MINNDHLIIIGVPEHGNVTLVADMELEGQPLQMMKEGDNLVIISAINSWNIPSDDPLRSIMQTDDGNWRSSNLVKYTVIDITNRSDPNVGREIFIEGSHETARMVNGTVRSVSHMWSYIPGINSYPSLPDGYWSIESWEDRMDIWNASVHDLLGENQAIIEALTLSDFAPQMHQRNTDGTISSPIQSMIVPAAESHGEIRSDARITMVTVGPIHRVNQDGMVTIHSQIGCSPEIQTVTVGVTTMGPTVVDKTATQMNSH